jgi:hypothetical protein
MQFNNIVVSSSSATNKVNEFNFALNFNDYVVMPKNVSVSKAVIPNVLLSFRPTQLSIFLYVSAYSSTYEIVIQNGYYDNLTEFLPMLQSATNTAVGNTEFIWSYSVAHEAIKLTNTSNHTFQVYNYLYSPRSMVKRLGFNRNLNYMSYPETEETQVVYATGLCRLYRTSCFYLMSSIVPNHNTACPGNITQIVDMFPVDVQGLAYGDNIVIINNNIPVNKVRLPQSDMYDANSTFQFQLVDDEFQGFDNDLDKGACTSMFINLDFD